LEESLAGTYRSEDLARIRQLGIQDARRASSQLSAALADLRRRSNMSQADLAAAVGTSQPHISTIESGGDVLVSTVERLVQKLGGKITYHLEIPSLLSPEFTEVRRAVSALDSERPAHSERQTKKRRARSVSTA
jgi:transcriptional regulator with XRE-family HTH domain